MGTRHCLLPTTKEEVDTVVSSSKDHAGWRILATQAADTVKCERDHPPAPMNAAFVRW